MMESGTKKKLTIVVNNETRQYGELLLALTLMKDDMKNNDGTTTEVGIKDESVEAIVWDEKIYLDNQPKIAATQKIVFVGRMNSTDAIINNFNCSDKFAEYGIRCGWLGNKAVIYVNDDSSLMRKNNYNLFVDDYIKYLNNVGTDFTLAQNIEKGNFKLDNYEQNVEQIQKGLNTIADTAIKLVGKRAQLAGAETTNETELADTNKGVTAGVAKALALVYTPLQFSNDVRIGKVKTVKKTDVKDMQYRFAVTHFYYDMMRKFME